MNLGEVIKQYRKEHDLSMQAFADKCNLSKGYIAMLERNINSKTGEPVVPSIETFIKVSKAMNIPLAELLDLVDENQPVSLDTSALESKLTKIAEEKALQEKMRNSDLTPLEAEFVELFLKLPADKKTLIIQIMKSYL